MTIGDRLEKVDDRIIVMVKKYPVVFGVILGVGLIVGFLAGRFI